jgi:hypothetical protein
MSIRILFPAIAIGVSMLIGSFLPLSKGGEDDRRKSLFPSQSMYPNDGGSGILISGTAITGCGVVTASPAGPQGQVIGDPSYELGRFIVKMEADRFG